MESLIYLFLISIIFLFLNIMLVKKKYLLSFSGDNHQKYTSKNNIPLTGGILLFALILFFFNENYLLFKLFAFLIILLGIVSDLKIIHSANKRLTFQLLILFLFIFLNDLNLSITRIDFLDNLLLNKYFNYFFLLFCILIVINGSNFIDGLNTLNLGYFSIVISIIYFLNIDGQIIFHDNTVGLFLIFLSFIFLLNFLNLIFLGDSGSYLMGFCSAYILISIYNLNNNISPFFIILLLWYPCFETLFSIIRKNLMKKSPMKPDVIHLHQLIYYYLSLKFKFKVIFINIFTANIINFFNFVVFFIGKHFIYNTKMQIFLILLSLLVYMTIYFKLYNFKKKRL